MNFEFEFEIIGLLRLLLKLRYYTLLLFSAILFLGSCSISKNAESKFVINKQKVSGNKNFENWELEEFYRLKRNKRIFGFIPSYHAYNLGMKKRFLGIFIIYDKKQIRSKIDKLEDKFGEKLTSQPKDSTKIIRKFNKKIQKKNEKLNEGTWLAKSVGQPPVIFDTIPVNKTAQQIELFIRSKGYLGCEVRTRIDTLKSIKKYKKVNVKYKIKEGKPHVINAVNYEVADIKILHKLEYFHKNTNLKLNENYEISNVTAERSRIFNLLKNSGYYKFKKQYISFAVDTSIGDRKVNILIKVTSPEAGGMHNKYNIRNVYFTIEGTKNNSNDTIFYEDVAYIRGDKKYSKKILNRHIHFKKGDFYAIKNFRKTQKELGNIDIFKYININFLEVDSTNLDVFIYASPFDKYQISTEFGVSVNLQGQTLPGPFATATFRDRNVFRGFEIFEANIRYALEGQISLTDENDVQRLEEFGVNTSLTFPKILIPTNLKNHFSSFNPKSRLVVGFSDVDRKEYKRTSFKAALTYTWQPKRKINYSLTPLDINLLNSRVKTTEFKDYLTTLSINGNNLNQSFEPSIVSGFNFTRIYNTNFSQGRKNAWYNRLSIETGGSTFKLLDNTFSVQNNDSIAKLPFFQYTKFQFDIRHYKPLATNTTIVGRINVGAARPYGVSTVLPYEKFFFTGGSNSIRAWNPRRLGPGSFTPSTTSSGQFDYRFEQPGEILIESNLEIRSKLFSFVHGALFLDIGNIYTFSNDPTRPGSQFKFNSFLNDLAIGSGAGLRFDFSFLILRLDLGIKIKDPARNIGNRFVPFGEKGQFALNFGIGYPF